MTMGIIQVIKYTKGHTTYTERREYYSFLSYPYVSFCPGFKPHAESDHLWIPKLMTSVELSHVNGGHPKPFPKGYVHELWMSTTYNFEEVVSQVRVYNLDLGDLQDCWEVKTIWTVSGRCYILSLPCSEKQMVNGLNIAFNMSLLKRSLSLYIHNELSDAFFGLNDNYWLQTVSWERLNKEESTIVGLKKHVKKHTRGVTNREYFACVKKVFRQLAVEVTEADPTFCMSPSFGGLLEALPPPELQIQNCTDQNATLKSVRAFGGLLSRLYFNVPCPLETEMVNYHSHKKKMNIPEGLLKEGMSEVYLYYESLEVVFAEEYALLDVGTLFSTLGGIIGMFLGWSALHVVTILCQALERFSVSARMG